MRTWQLEGPTFVKRKRKQTKLQNKQKNPTKPTNKKKKTKRTHPQNLKTTTAINLAKLAKTVYAACNQETVALKESGINQAELSWSTKAGQW